MKVRKLLPFALIATILLTYLATGQAKVLADAVVGTGTPASCTEDALSAVLAAGGMISFNCGAAAVTIQIRSPKTISLNTVIDGNNLITLDGGGQSYFLYINNFQGVNVTVKNLTFVNGSSAQEGGAIHAHFKSNLTVINCTFTNNMTTSTMKQFDGGGGAIFVGSEATASISGSTFTNNSGANGGAIYSLNSTLSIDGSTFVGNTANLTSTKSGSGGAIWNDTGPITITNSVFTSNSALLQGGALAVSPDNVHETGNFNVSNTTFTNNSSYFQNQGNGGAIFNQQPLSLVGSTFSGNKARVGGALWLGANSTLANDTIANNSAVSPDGQHGLGAGLNISGGTVSLINVTVASNYADYLGGGVFGKATGTVKNTIIANNVANNGGNNWNIQNQCSTAQTNSGNNIDFPNNECGFGSSAVKDPKLGVLADNGGPTQTMALLAGSSALDAGNGAACAASPVNNIDQRGVSRASNTPCDIGAYEYDKSLPTATSSTTQTITPTATNTPLTPTATSTNTPPTATFTSTSVTPTATSTATWTNTPLTPTVTPTNTRPTASPTADKQPTVLPPPQSGYHRPGVNVTPPRPVHAQSILPAPIKKSCSSDNRLNGCTAIPLTVYCSPTGIVIYDIDTNGQAIFAFQATVLQITTALAQAINSHKNVLIAQGLNDSLYALTSNELQAMGPEIVVPQKTYIFTFRPGDFAGRCTWASTIQASGLVAPTPVTPTPVQAPRGAAQSVQPGTKTYVIQSGDTLSRIAQRFGVSVQALAEINSISDPSHILAGQTLLIPDSGTLPTSEPTQSEPPKAEVSATVAAPPTAQSVQVNQPDTTMYRVQTGDTLPIVAQRFNLSMDILVSANPDALKKPLTIGQQLVIPIVNARPPVVVTLAPSIAPATVKPMATLTFTSTNLPTTTFTPAPTETMMPTPTSIPTDQNAGIVYAETLPTNTPIAVALLSSLNSSDSAHAGSTFVPPNNLMQQILHQNSLLILLETLIFLIPGYILCKRIVMRRLWTPHQQQQLNQMQQTTSRYLSGADGAVIRQAAKLISAGEKQRATVLITTVIQNNSNNAEAWYLFSFVADDLNMRVSALERALYLEPKHDRARDRLEKLRPSTFVTE